MVTFYYSYYQNWQQPDNATHLIDRGFCMHQHLDYFHLINMEGRMYDPVVAKLRENYVGNDKFSGISFGHYVLGEDIALNHNDGFGHNLDMFAHEYGHIYQSRIMGPLYLYRVGMSSAVYQGSTEGDATRRGSSNLGIIIQNTDRFPSGTSTYKWWESAFSPVIWPFMWMWNK